MYQLYWMGPIRFGLIQIIKISPEKSNSNMTKIIWIQPKLFGPDQNNLYPFKTIWTVQKHFGPIEGQDTIGSTGGTYQIIFAQQQFYICPQHTGQLQ